MCAWTRDMGSGNDYSGWYSYSGMARGQLSQLVMLAVLGGCSWQLSSAIVQAAC